MPHFILDCSPDLFSGPDKTGILQAVFDTAKESGLFKTTDIKVRLRVYDDFITGGTADEFVHVFAYIMEGRTTAQKSALSQSIVGRLKGMFPDVPVVSLNVMDFEKATYSNRNTV
jgi:5-carboxymethyl-2-hydroxymuconate isomerase